jgi:hypothetical protein
MQFLSRVFSATPKTSRVRQADRSPRRRRAQFSVESLEGRDLKSDIPGVSDLGRVISISATQAAQNRASVEIDPNNGNVQISLNGNSVEYSRNAVWSVTFSGGQGGGDVFRNDTNIPEVATGYGGNNQFLGGSSWNTVSFWGDNNSYDARGGASYVYTFGSGDNIVPYNNVSVFSYNNFSVW